MNDITIRTFDRYFGHNWLMDSSFTSWCNFSTLFFRMTKVMILVETKLYIIKIFGYCESRSSLFNQDCNFLCIEIYLKCLLPDLFLYLLTPTVAIINRFLISILLLNTRQKNICLCGILFLQINSRITIQFIEANDFHDQ